MNKIEEIYDRIYYLNKLRDGTELIHGEEREELLQKIKVLKDQIRVLKTPPLEKKVIIDEILKLRPDYFIIYPEPIVQLNYFSLEQLKKHLEKIKNNPLYRIFSDDSIKKIKAEKAVKLGTLVKEYKPTIKDLILGILEKKAVTLDELTAEIKANPLTVKATVTYHLKKAGYNIIEIKEGPIVKYRIDGRNDSFVSTVVPPSIIETPKVEEPKPIEVKKVSYPKEGIPNFIIKLLKERPHSLQELSELSGGSLSTIKTQVLYMLKKKGVNVKPIAEPGVYEIRYTIE